MAKYPGADTVYEAAQQFRSRCLEAGTSLLWPEERSIWTPENLTSLWDALVGGAIEGPGTFLDKLKSQLEAQPVPVHRLAADALTFYYLFPSNVGLKRKL